MLGVTGDVQTAQAAQVRVTVTAYRYYSSRIQYSTARPQVNKWNVVTVIVKFYWMMGSDAVMARARGYQNNI